MTKPFLSLILLVLALPLACSGEDELPSPLASRAGFCKSWAESACVQSVVEACNATSTEDCVQSQQDFCDSIVPSAYVATKADACIGAVRSAYGDAKLTAEEIQLLRHLGAPCDQLSKGSLVEGEICVENDDCNTAAGIFCIKKQGASTGSCEEPEEVPAGDTCDLPNQVCDDEHYCNGENCVVYKKANASCDADYECSPEQRCLLETGKDTGKCTPRADVNDMCSSDDDCQSRYCVRESGASEGECASFIVLTRIDPLCDDLQ